MTSPRLTGPQPWQPGNQQQGNQQQDSGQQGSGQRYSGLSWWHDSLLAANPNALDPRPGLDGDTEADVCIVGAGYTGLWTAYYLLDADPSLRVQLVEAEIAGFGASGRNGGWCSALFPTDTAALARRHGRDAAVAMRRTMQETVREVGRVCANEGIDAHYRAGGTLYLARTPVQWARAQEMIEQDRHFGGIENLELLDAEAATQRAGASSVLGAAYTPHCARIHPARLARGLADVVERRGARIAERTRVNEILPGGVRTDRGLVNAPVVVRATEAWTAALPGSHREVIPVYSLIVATEPLPTSFWATAGLARGETFSDLRHLIIYGQRTDDDRLVFGGRGAPYHLGSRIRPGFDREPEVFAALRRTACELFPGLSAAQFTHAWGGPLGIPRDWSASVGLAPVDGAAGARFGWAGGYVGDGVGTANLAGRTLAELITGQVSERTTLPWVGHRSRAWEPEPLRWLGVNAGLVSMTLADAEERVSGRESVIARLMAPMVGH